MNVNPDNVALLHEAIEKELITGAFLPSVYVLEPISRCNIRCVMCPNSQMKPDALGDMDLEVFEHILKLISPFAEFLMLYWMGEPLLHPNIKNLLELARLHINGKIVVSTNMTHVSDEILGSLLLNCDIILCSIDRWDAKAYEKIRRGAEFASVVNNIERLLTLKMPHYPAEVVVKALDIDHSSEEYNRFQEHWLFRGARPLLAWLNDWAGTFSGLRSAASLPIPRAALDRCSCADLWFKMVINWRGDVQICCFDWQYAFPLGNLSHSTSLHDIWHSSQLIELRRAHRAGNFKITDLCDTCTTWGEPAEHDAYINFNDSSYYIVF